MSPASWCSSLDDCYQFYEGVVVSDSMRGELFEQALQVCFDPFLHGPVVEVGVDGLFQFHGGRDSSV